MKNLKIILILLLAITAGLSSKAYAGSGTGTGTGSGSGGAGGCDWKPFLDKLASQEAGFMCKGGGTCDAQYLATYDKPHKTKAGVRDVTMGKYQFTPSEWVRLTGSEYPQCLGYTGSQNEHTNPPANLKVNVPNMYSKDCWPVQEWAAAKLQAENLEKLKKKNYCGLLGTTIAAGQHTGGGATSPPCTATESGLLSAMHNGGAGFCETLKANGYWAPHLRYRICSASGVPVPGACTPPAPTVPNEIKPPQPPPFISTTPNGPPKGHFNNLSDILKQVWVAAFQLMTSQLSTIMEQQVMIIGTFFDAKHQLETQRLMQQKFAEAHKDYQPSLQMCEIGTFVRNLADSEKRTDLTQAAMSRAMLDRALGAGAVKTGGTGPEKIASDEDTRLYAFINKFCLDKDNAKENEKLCKGSTAKATMKDADINFTQTIDGPLTLKVNLLDEKVEDEETTLFSFIDYIFMNDRFPWMSANDMVRGGVVNRAFIEPYQDMRSLIAMRSVAQNSFAHIIAEKTQGPEEEETTVAPFLRALMSEMGISGEKGDDGLSEIDKYIGKNPSYFAQMEILTKKIYQHPEFVANLYDKPANVKRIRAAMTAIKLMQDRDIHEALLRREMLMSILLELNLRNQQDDLEFRELRDILATNPE